MTDRTGFGLIFLLWAAGLGAAAQYGKVSVIYDRLPLIYPDAGLTLGFVVSVVGFVGIVFGVIAGVLVAAIGLRRALIWALWGGASVSAFEATLPVLPVMLGLRALEGVSHLVIVVAAPTLIAQLSTPRHLGLTLTLWSTFFGVAYTALVWGGLPMVDALGLPSLFVAHAVWMAAAALLVALRIPTLASSPEPTRNKAVMSPRAIFEAHRSIYRSPFLAAPGLGWLFYTFCFLALLTLLPPYIDPADRALVIGAMPLVSILVSMTAGVWLMRHVSAIFVVQLGFAACVGCLVWLLIAEGNALACFVLAAALGLVQGASFAAVPQLNPEAADRARANGAMAQMGNVGNTLGTPALAALAMFGGYTALLWAAVIVMSLGAVMHMVLARRRAAS